MKKEKELADKLSFEEKEFIQQLKSHQLSAHEEEFLNSFLALAFFLAEFLYQISPSDEKSRSDYENKHPFFVLSLFATWFFIGAFLINRISKLESKQFSQLFCTGSLDEKIFQIDNSNKLIQSIGNFLACFIFIALFFQRFKKIDLWSTLLFMLGFYSNRSTFSEVFEAVFYYLKSKRLSFIDVLKKLTEKSFPNLEWKEHDVSFLIKHFELVPKEKIIKNKAGWSNTQRINWLKELFKKNGISIYYKKQYQYFALSSISESKITPKLKRIIENSVILMDKLEEFWEKNGKNLNKIAQMIDRDFYEQFEFDDDLNPHIKIELTVLGEEEKIKKSIKELIEKIFPGVLVCLDGTTLNFIINSSIEIDMDFLVKEIEQIKKEFSSIEKEEGRPISEIVFFQRETFDFLPKKGFSVNFFRFLSGSKNQFSKEFQQPKYNWFNQTLTEIDPSVFQSGNLYIFFDEDFIKKQGASNEEIVKFKKGEIVKIQGKKPTLTHSINGIEKTVKLLYELKIEGKARVFGYEEKDKLSKKIILMFVLYDAHGLHDGHTIKKQKIPPLQFTRRKPTESNNNNDLIVEKKY